MVHLPEPTNDDAASARHEPGAATADAHDAGVAGPEATARARRMESAKTPPPADAPRPIGLERLRALREAIRNGTYPTPADVAEGLVTMFGEPGAPEPTEDEVD